MPAKIRPIKNTTMGKIDAMNLKKGDSVNVSVMVPWEGEKRRFPLKTGSTVIWREPRA
jgi:hypothetical protein